MSLKGLTDDGTLMAGIYSDLIWMDQVPEPLIEPFWVNPIEWSKSTMPCDRCRWPFAEVTELGRNVFIRYCKSCRRWAEAQL